MKEFLSPEHKAEIARLESLWKNLEDLAKMAKEYGIDDMLQDNGVKVLQQLVYLNMDLLPGREGNDSISKSGIEWEMKSANEALVSGFSTNHHTTHDIIAKYRQVPWTFAIYDGIILKEIYVLTPQQLEPIYKKWEEKIQDDARTKNPKNQGDAHINNPKIPIKFVRENGVKVYPYNDVSPIDPDSIPLE